MKVIKTDDKNYREKIYWLVVADCRVVVESESSPSNVDWFPVTAIAAVVPGGISVESTRPMADSLAAAVVAFRAVLGGVSVESPPAPGFSAEVAVVVGGISTTMTSCDPSTTPDDFVCVAVCSCSSAV